MDENECKEVNEAVKNADAASSASEGNEQMTVTDLLPTFDNALGLSKFCSQFLRKRAKKRTYQEMSQQKLKEGTTDSHEADLNAEIESMLKDNMQGSKWRKFMSSQADQPDLQPSKSLFLDSFSQELADKILQKCQ